MAKAMRKKMVKKKSSVLCVTVLSWAAMVELIMRSMWTGPLSYSSERIAQINP